MAHDGCGVATLFDQLRHVHTSMCGPKDGLHVAVLLASPVCCSIPGKARVYLQVLAPYDAEDARGLLKAAIRDPDPVVFLENEILYGEAFPVNDKILDKDFVVPIGKVKVTTQLQNCPGSVWSSLFACKVTGTFLTHAPCILCSTYVVLAWTLHTRSAYCLHPGTVSCQAAPIVTA